MRKALALLAVVSVAGCEYNVREEPASGRGERSAFDIPPPSASPMPSSSGTKMPSLPPPTDGDASAGPVSSCQGAAIECSSLDAATCSAQRGCVESHDDGTCYGSPIPCDWLMVDTACEAQLGCSWSSSSSAEPSPPR